MSRNKKLPYWYAKKIADIINFKYHSFTRESAEPTTWIDWRDCQKFNSNRLEIILTQKTYQFRPLNPAWKFRSIQVKNRLQKVYLNFLPSFRESYLKKTVNTLPERIGDLEKLSPIFMEAAHLKMTRLNCYARDLRDEERVFRSKKWYLSAKRNYLRMRSGKFSHIAEEYSKWDLCFLANRRSFENFKLNPWESTFMKVRNSFLLTTDSRSEINNNP